MSELVLLDGQPTFVVESLEDMKEISVSLILPARAFRHLSEAQRKVCLAHLCFKSCRNFDVSHTIVLLSLQDLINNLTGDVMTDFQMIFQAAFSGMPSDASFIEHRLALVRALHEYAASASNTFSGKTVVIRSGLQSTDKVNKQLIQVK